jgi:DNA polymerase III subunit delta
MAKSTSDGSISISEIIKQVEKNIFFPIYLFYGNEQYIVEEIIRLIIDKCVDPALRQLNVEKYYCSETDSETIVTSALSIPMLSERKVIVVRDYEKINDSKALRHYFEFPSQSTILILTANTIDKRKSIFSIVAKIGAVIKCENLKRPELIEWVKNKIHSYGKDISDTSIEMLFDLKGNSLQEVYTELDKVITFAGEKQFIEDKDILSVTGATKEFNVFELINLIGSGEKTKAIIMMNKLLDQNTEPILIVNLLSRHFIILWKIQNLKRINKNPNEIASVVQINPYFLKDYLSQAEKFNLVRLEKCINFLKDADLQLKSVSLPKRIILDRLLCDLVNPVR